MGYIDKAARLASRMPDVANLVGQAPGLSNLLKLAGGVSQKRRVPRFADVTLRDWFLARGERNPGGPRVLLWADTFNNYFHADIGVHAVEVLERFGYNVVIPSTHLCCGRPLYDYGFLNSARRYLERTIDGIRDEIRAGTPLVGIEPSCLAVFKDELTKLLPNDYDGKRLANQAFHFAEFLEREKVEMPKHPGRAVLWGHCHHKATGGIASEQRLLEAMGMTVDEAKGGCCGLAGSWGFESEHHDLSMQIGEEGLFPAVRHASPDAAIVADGFSCRTQLEHAKMGRAAVHIAELIARAQGQSGNGQVPNHKSRALIAGAAGVAALGALGAAARHFSHTSQAGRAKRRR
jgi:Fe-S oxidoreductase